MASSGEENHCWYGDGNLGQVSERDFRTMIQTLYNLLLNTPNTTVGNKIVIQSARLMEKAILRFRAPVVKYKLAGTEIRIPWTHDLPSNLKGSPHYSTNVARIGRYAKEKFRDFVFIDIGANVGDTAILARQLSYYPILSIEGDQFFFSLLRENLASYDDVTLVNAFVGDSSEAKNCTLHRYLGSVRIEPNPNQGSPIQFKTLQQILQQHPRFSRSKLLKIDTDGFDLKILRGALDFLQSVKPVLFFEYDPHFLAMEGDDGISIFPLLQSLGYKKLIVYDNSGYYLLSAGIDDVELLQDLHYYSHAVGRYCDICVFHREDSDLFVTVKTGESKYVRELHCGRG
jgi:FkbM family methyltransferase